MEQMQNGLFEELYELRKKIREREKSRTGRSPVVCSDDSLREIVRLMPRKESDFYHAIPFTRGCVYTSFVVAILTWVWGVLIVSSLSAALVWALCPYVTFSFGGLLTHMLLACLNAALLAAFTTVAVSLTGTATTAVVTTLLVMWSWRLVLLFARMSLSDLLRITPINSILGGYLRFSFLLPISIIVGEVTTPMVIYAVVITLAMFALGGLLYS